jgi:hypothetical protein
MNLRQPLLLFTVAAARARVAYAIDIEAADLLGCWDDQFNGTASTHLRITARTIVTLYDAYPPPLVHEIMGDFTTCFETNNDQVDARGVSFVTKNGPTSTDPDLYSDFDMMLASNGDDALVVYYCQVSLGDVSKLLPADEAVRRQN